MNLLISKALEIAKKAHENQLRKFTNEPYIVHPIAVFGIVYSVTEDINMLTAAILHDVVEDTEWTIEEIGFEFGDQIAQLVSDLTDVSKLSDGNRKIRKAMDLQHTKEATPNAKTIKLADLIDNTKSIVAFDPNFARVYMHEKSRLLGVLTEGDPKLFCIAEGLIKRYYKIRKV